MSTEAASFLTTSTSTPAITATATTINNSSSSVAKREMKLTVTQCFLYGIVFISSTIWPTIVVILITVQSDDNPDDGGSYILSNGQLFLAIVVHTFYPLQGFFYFCVYIRPRYLTVMRLWDDQQARQEEHQLVTTNGQVEPLSSSSVETPPPLPQSQLRPKRNRLHALYHAVVYPINTQRASMTRSYGSPPSTSSSNTGLFVAETSRSEVIAATGDSGIITPASATATAPPTNSASPSVSVLVMEEGLEEAPVHYSTPTMEIDGT